jgi:molybdopterin-biosynthesis enzyme MoeA-like protein
MKKVNFFAVIIGTEILNDRRKDKHFDFIKNELISRGWELKGVFIIKDEPDLMRETFQMLKNYPDSVIFSFGGIGSTPDDYTRQIASEIFTNKVMSVNSEFKAKIEQKFSHKYDPKSMSHRIKMAHLPENAELLYNNPVNGMYAFYLEKRFFFLPGFPEMAHPMVIEALDKFYKKNRQEIFSSTLTAKVAESFLIDWMKNLPSEIEFSSLPKTNIDKNGVINPTVTISLKSENLTLIQENFSELITILNKSNISFQTGEVFDF